MHLQTFKLEVFCALRESKEQGSLKPWEHNPKVVLYKPEKGSLSTRVTVLPTNCLDSYVPEAYKE